MPQSGTSCITATRSLRANDSCSSRDSCLGSSGRWESWRSTRSWPKYPSRHTDSRKRSITPVMDASLARHLAVNPADRLRPVTITLPWRAVDASITGVIERFLESVCLDGYFGQERVERHDSHRPDEPRHESLDEHESFARR